MQPMWDLGSRFTGETPAILPLDSQNRGQAIAALISLPDLGM